MTSNEEAAVSTQEPVVNPYDMDNLDELLAQHGENKESTEKIQESQEEETKQVVAAQEDFGVDEYQSVTSVYEDQVKEGRVESPRAIEIDDRNKDQRESQSDYITLQTTPLEDQISSQLETDHGDQAQNDEALVFGDDEIGSPQKFTYERTMKAEVTETDETDGRAAPNSPLVEDGIKYRTEQVKDPLANKAPGPTSFMYHSTPQVEHPAPTRQQSRAMTLQEKVFAKLLQEDPNQYCFDCGWTNPTHVSINHGIFLCGNCATGIHVEHYPMEVSFIKTIATDEFNYLQLRVLINGGNQAAYDFFEVYDLHNEPVQKRYNTNAAQCYRDKIKGMLESGYMVPSADKSAPSWDEGRSAIQATKQQTPQNRPYSQLNNREILQELLTWEHINFEKTGASSDEKRRAMRDGSLLGKYDKYIQDKENENAQLHNQMKELQMASFKNKKQAQAAIDALPAPDPSLPPFRKVANEPYGDTNSFTSKFNDDVVLDKINEFADSTIKMGESLFKRISQADFFSSRGTTSENPENEEESKDGAPDENNQGQANPPMVDDSIDGSQYTTSQSVLGGPNVDKDGQGGLGAVPINVGSIRYNNLREKTADRLISAGKSLWGYFTSSQAAQAASGSTPAQNHQQQPPPARP